MTYSHAIYCQQIGLKSLGFDPGPADGLDGPKTQAALRASERARMGSGVKSAGVTVPRPGPNYRAKVRVFGEPGRESALTRVTCPWPLKIAWSGGTRKTLRVHRMIAQPMEEALQALLRAIGIKGVHEYGMDLFGGDYADRKSRAGNATSDHAWGIAVDFNPDANGLWTRWEPGALAANGTRQMSQTIVKIFQRYGFQVGFRRSDGSRRDMMHVAYVDRA